MGYKAHCDTVAAQIITRLENGEIPPWSRPWHTTGTDMPISSHGRPYRGINRFVLGMLAMEYGYSSPIWITFKQAVKIGGAAMKGEKATKVMGFKRELVDEDEDGNKVKPAIRFHSFVYNVFNTEQCTGLDVSELPNLPTRPPDTGVTPLQRATQIIDAMPNRPALVHGGNVACYDPRMDLVRMPPAGAHISAEHHAGVMFHEFVHSTGHPTRLDRGVDTPKVFGSTEYGIEELTAEMGAAMLCGIAGIETPARQVESAAYIKSWLKVIKEDTSVLVSAAQRAQHATDYILGEHRSQTA